MNKVWLNGALVDADAARIDPADRGFTLGDGLFETMAARGGQALRLDAHLARLRQGCEVLGIPRPQADIAAALGDVLKANNLAEAAVRLTLTRGPAARGLLPPHKVQPTLLLVASPLSPRPQPARCIIATVTRRNEYSPLARIKSVNYLDNILTRQEAASRNADDAILLNTAGRVAEASAANIFVVKGDKLLTPPVSDGALPGTMRAAVMAKAAVIEQPLMPQDLREADGIFLTSSLGLRPVASLEGRAFENWQVTQKLSAEIDYDFSK